MEHAIEQATRIIHGCTGDEDGATVAARALAEAGLLVLVPLREARYTLICEDGIAHGSYGTAEEAARHADHDASVMVSYSTGWMRVDRAEGESWYDAEPDAMPDAGWEPIEPVDRAEGDGRADRPSWVDEHGINHADGGGGRW